MKTILNSIQIKQIFPWIFEELANILDGRYQLKFENLNFKEKSW